MRTKELISYFFLIVTWLIGSSQVLADTSGQTKYYAVSSTVFGVEREISITLPNSYEQNSGKRYPVLYMLEGGRYLSHVSSVTALLAARRKMPELIIVNIPAGKTRQRDYTPDYLSHRKSDEKGRSSDFVKFMTDDLMPFVTENFRAKPFRILAGHSRSGLFAVDEAIKDTRPFQAYFAFSPALWSDNYALISRAVNLLSARAAGKTNAFLYANVGGDENEKMLGSLSKLRTLLEKHAPMDMRWKTDLEPYESHGTTPLIGYYKAFRWLFLSWDKPLKAYGKEGYDAFLMERKRLENTLGYKVSFQERSLNAIGYGLLEKGDVARAISVFTENTEVYPTSAKAFDSLADAFEANDEMSKAYEASKRAVSLVKPGDANAQQVTEHYERFKNESSQ